jgi:hypothetical protein
MRASNFARQFGNRFPVLNDNIDPTNLFCGRSVGCDAFTLREASYCVARNTSYICTIRSRTFPISSGCCNVTAKIIVPWSEPRVCAAKIFASGRSAKTNSTHSNNRVKNRRTASTTRSGKSRDSEPNTQHKQINPSSRTAAS